MLLPPASMLHVAEGPINKAGYELARCDEQCVDGDQASSQVGWRCFSDVHRNGHGPNTWTDVYIAVKYRLFPIWFGIFPLAVHIPQM